jgi:sugar fermentation stimulation protein A
LQFPERLIPARFIKRDTRFSATVIVDGKKQYVHVPNSGRLGEILIPDREVFLLPSTGVEAGRKTNFTLVMARYGSGYVSLEAAKANDLFQEALAEGKIYEFRNFRIKTREKRLGMSRIDFLLEGKNGSEIFTEVKSVSLAANRRALFPDSPTIRGQKHLEELIRECKKGKQAAVVFVVQREDADCFSPNDQEDPQFGKILRQAFSEGVKILGYRCRIDLFDNSISDPIPVLL